jgi:hypothetical protein
MSVSSLLSEVPLASFQYSERCEEEAILCGHMLAAHTIYNIEYVQGSEEWNHFWLRAVFSEMNYI